MLAFLAVTHWCENLTRTEVSNTQTFLFLRYIQKSVPFFKISQETAWKPNNYHPNERLRNEL